MGSYQFNLADVLLFVAVPAPDDTFFLVDDVEYRVHRLVVRYSLGVVAFDYAGQFVGSLDGLFFNYFVILYDVEHYVGGNYREP